MTTRQLIFTKLVCVCIIMAAFSSCLDDDDTEQAYYYSTIGMLEKVDDNNYGIATDTGKKLLISNSSDIDSESMKSGRVYAEFTILDVVKEGYDNVIHVYFIYDVLVKDFVHLTDENMQEIGDDNISVSEIWTTDDYLNFRFQFYSGGGKTHYINLVTVDEPKQSEDGYLYVEFRHNANYDSVEYPYNGIASFRTADVLSENPSLKGFIIRVKTYSSGEKFYKISFDKADNKTDVKMDTYGNAGNLE